MSYGHMSLFFANADEARDYLASCAESGNYTAENYQDRVNAQRCIRQAEGWAPVPLPRPSRAAQPVPAKPSHSRARAVRK